MIATYRGDKTTDNNEKYGRHFSINNNSFLTFT